jgi:hypothetical protein
MSRADKQSWIQSKLGTSNKPFQLNLVACKHLGRYHYITRDIQETVMLKTVPVMVVLNSTATFL